MRSADLRTAPQLRNREATKEARILATRKRVSATTSAKAAMTSPDKPLTEKQKAFVRYIAEGENGYGALMRAGFGKTNPTYSVRLLAMPSIQRALSEARAQYAAASELKKSDVMEMFKESYQMAKLLSEPATMVSAARELGKLCGFYEPRKVELTVGVEGRKKVEQLTDDELFKMIEEAKTEVLAIEG